MMSNTGISTMAVFALASLFGSSMGHLYISSPVPFDVPNINNSPLKDVAPGSSTSDFPCKVASSANGGGGGYSYTITTMNNITVEEPQELNFVGSASHGGGTCQLAVSMDLEPTANSTWKIIQVYEGGCPIAADGNDGTHPFTYVIPKDFPNGRATLSWTWYNRIGNREIYQNCAPITVSGGSDSKDYYNSLPNWYIINLPDSSCGSPESENVQIPNPGQFVLTQGSISPATGSACSASAAAQTSGVSGYQSNVVSNAAAYNAPGGAAGATSAAGGSSPAVAQTSASATSAAAASAGASSPNSAGGYSAAATSTGTGSSAAVAASSSAESAPITMSTLATATTAASSPDTDSMGMSEAAPSSAAASAAASESSFPTTSAGTDAGVSPSANPVGTGSTPAGTGAAGTGGGAGSCTSDGTIVCNGADQFGICNFGSVVWQPVAAGTTCNNGQIQKRADMRNVHVRRAAQLEADAADLDV